MPATAHASTSTSSEPSPALVAARQAFEAERQMRQERIQEAEARLRALNATLADSVAAAQAAAEARSARADKLRVSIESTSAELDAPLDAAGKVEDSGSGAAGAGDAAAASGLSMTASVVHMDVTPARVQSYNKATQTQTEAVRQAQADAQAQAQAQTQTQTQTVQTPEQTQSSSAVDEEPGEMDPVAALEAAVQQLRPEAVASMAQTRSFQDFLSRASKRVERVLESGPDMGFGSGFGTVDEALGSGGSGGGFAAATVAKYEPGATAGTEMRGVSALSWSDVYPELFLVAYSDSYARANNAFAARPSVAPGYMEARSLSLASTPEYVFYAQSSITSAAFVRHNPNLVIGGTHSGQVLLWDTRTGSELPCASTPLAGGNHSCAVRTTAVAGTANNLSLATVSSDGAFITWSPESLAAPTERLNIPVPVSCMAFSSSSPNTFYVGSLTGSLWSVLRHGPSKGPLTEYSQHTAVVSGISVSPHTAKLDYDLILASSLDWSMSLWRSDMDEPVYVYADAPAYIHDVGWSPRHPGVFAAGSGDGRLLIWDLLEASNGPVASLALTDGTRPVTHVEFSGDGSLILAGDGSGSVSVVKVSPERGVDVDVDEEFERFDAVLTQLEQAR